MKTKTIQQLAAALVFSAMVCLGPKSGAQTNSTAVMSTPPLTLDEEQAMYNATVEDRVLKIMTALAVSDADKSNRVHTAILAQYHALHARDEAIEDELWNLSKGSPEWLAQRNAMFPQMSQPLHARFLALVSPDLTADQLETLKDKMTYGKVPFTYNAYCSILPDLSDEDKGKVMDLLKQAREVAMDGGNSGEKTAIFQEYKNQINAYLAAKGFDVAKATQAWSAQQAAKKATATSPNGNTPAQ
jgi:hypothetical protein